MALKRNIHVGVYAVSGFHPVWNETVEFDITCPDLAIVHFKVMDHEDRRSNKLVAQYALPFRCMQNGKCVCPSVCLFVDCTVCFFALW